MKLILKKYLYKIFLGNGYFQGKSGFFLKHLDWPKK